MTNNRLNKIKNVVTNHYADDLGSICLGAMIILLWCIIMATSPVFGFLGTLAIMVGYLALTEDEDYVEEIIIIEEEA